MTRRFSEAQRRYESQAEPGHPRLEERWETCPACGYEPSGACKRCKGRGFVVRWVEIAQEVTK